MANVGIIRQALLDAQRYHQRRATDDPPERDLKHEALGPLLNREIPALVAASRVDEIATALRLADEFGFRMILVGAADARFVADKLAAANVAVLYPPAGDDLYASAAPDSVLSVPSILATHGVRYALVSGDAPNAPRVDLLIHASTAVGRGLPPEDALRAITIGPAQLLGIDKQFGSIEPSKSADLVLFTGDPFNAESHITAVVIGGRINDRGSS
jgi:imidazolonepropionase-like amidohydrolase